MCTHILHGRSLEAIDPLTPTMPERRGGGRRAVGEEAWRRRGKAKGKP